MSLYDGDWSLYREDMCICPKCGRDEITHCVCDEEQKLDDFEKLYLISPDKLEYDFITIDEIISIVNGLECRVRQFDLNTFYCIDNMGINFNVNKYELSNRCLSFIINKGFDVNISIKKSNNFMPYIQLFVYGHEIFEEFGNCQSEIVFNAFRFAYIQAKPK